MGDNNGDEKGRRGIRWDEETIAEHDKLRGTRQKIDEPPTPYHVSYEPADAEDSNMDIGSADGEGGGGLQGSYSTGSISSSHGSNDVGGPFAQHRVSRSGSVCSGPGTPSDAAKKSQPGYLAENWQALTTALEQAARNREALISRSSSSSSSASGSGGGGESFSPSMSRSGSSSSSSRRERATSFSSDSEFERLAEEKRIKCPEHKAFAQKRLCHYDEYKRLQEWRQAHEREEEEEEEEEDKEVEKEVEGGGDG